MSKKDMNLKQEMSAQQASTNTPQESNQLKEAIAEKNRSYIACIKEAFALFAGNVKRIVTHTWLYALVMAMATALVLNLLFRQTLSDEMTPSALYAIAAAAVFQLLTLAAFQASMMRLVNGQRIAWNIKRSLRMVLLGVLIGIILVVMPNIIATIIYHGPVQVTPDNYLRLAAILCCWYAVVYILCLPMVHTGMRYFILPQATFGSVLGKAYLHTWRHWGFIFTTMLLTLLFTTVIGALLSLPWLITLAAKACSEYGVAVWGDPAGLPSYFPLLQFVTATVSTLIYAYITIFIMFVCLYIHGTINTRDKEREEQKRLSAA